jgi:hypothetical protein
VRDQSWEVILDQWTSESFYSVCSSREDALREVKLFIDRQPAKWGVRIDRADGEQEILQTNEVSGNWVRIREVIREDIPARSSRRWGDYDTLDRPAWPAKLAISAGGLILLQLFGDAFLRGTDLEFLMWPAHIIVILWLITLWTGGGRLR